MNVGAVGAVGSGAAPVYAALSPYLNGVRRTSNAAAAAAAQAAASVKSAAATEAAIAARQTAQTTITAAPPFLNPAIPAIAAATSATASVTTTGADPTIAAANTSFGAIDTVTSVNPNTVAPPAPSATDSVLHGDGGELVQAYGAVALLSGPPPSRRSTGCRRPRPLPRLRRSSRRHAFHASTTPPSSALHGKSASSRVERRVGLEACMNHRFLRLALVLIALGSLATAGTRVRSADAGQNRHRVLVLGRR